MADVSYTPGSWVGVAGQRVWLLAEINGAEPLVSRWWSLVAGGASVDELLGTIVHEGFRVVGNFAIVTGDRVVLRGRAGVELLGGAGEPRRVSADDVATWVDVPVDAGFTGIRITSDHTETATRLPLGAGVVLASELVVAFAPGLVEVPAQEQPEPAGPPEPVQPKPEQPEQWRPPEEQAGYEYLLHETRHVPAPPPAPVHAPEPVPVPVGANTMTATEFDDSGVLVNIDFGTEQPPPPVSAAPTVAVAAMTVRRPGHVNHRAPDEPGPIGALRLSTGAHIPLDRGVILGREPQPPPGEERTWNRYMLPSPGNDISRNHLEVRIVDRQVLITDLGSTNGTTVTVPGMTSWPLQPGEPVPIEPGTVVSLADEISFTFEGTE